MNNQPPDDIIKAINAFVDTVAPILCNYTAGLDRAVEQVTRSLLAARLSVFVGPRAAHWLAQRWPRRLLPAKYLWRRGRA